MTRRLWSSATVSCLVNAHERTTRFRAAAVTFAAAAAAAAAPFMLLPRLPDRCCDAADAGLDEMAKLMGQGMQAAVLKLWRAGENHGAADSTSQGTGTDNKSKKSKGSTRSKGSRRSVEFKFDDSSTQLESVGSCDGDARAAPAACAAVPHVAPHAAPAPAP